MKKIEAIIRETKFQEVKTKLGKLGIRGLTAYEVRPKMKIEIICIEEEVNKVTSSIVANAFTGNPGDGKIFIYDVQDVIKISTAGKSDIQV
jgi:nitrogen regulatory protein P-II 1